MDPNDPNNQGQAQGAVPPPAPGDATPDQLTPDALYGPSTPGVDPNAQAPAPAAGGPADVGGLTDPMQAPPTEVAPPADLPPMDQGAMPTYQDTTTPDADFTQDALPPTDEQQPDLNNPYYEPQPGAEGTIPMDPNAPAAPPPEGGVPANGLPPIPGKSKLPLIIIGVVVGLLLIGGLTLVLVLSRGRSAQPKTTPAPSAQELTCEEDPTQPGCEVSPTPEATATPLPTSFTSTGTSGSAGSRPTLSPQQCQLLYGGPCPQ